MNAPTCTRRLTFESGHRVMGHESKCACLHGHSYKAWITARADAVDGIGRVIDFSVLKAKIGAWIDEHWDHGFILHQDDRAAEAALTMFDDFGARHLKHGFKQKVHRLPYNPTAENMAKYLLEVVGPEALAGTGVVVSKVVIMETENCTAEASL